MTGYKYSNKRLHLVLFLLLFVNSIPVIAQYNENLIKAAYIERITRFIEWPSSSNLLSKGVFVIGVFKEDDFYFTLNEVFKDVFIKDRKVEIIAINNPEQINKCNLCYLSQKAKPLINKFMTLSKASGVLLFAATSGFGQSGVHINFYIEDEKLKFEINEEALISTGFKMSYLLMQNNRIIK